MLIVTACGGSGEATTVVEEATAAPDVKALELEKETAEAQAEQARIEAKAEKEKAKAEEDKLIRQAEEAEAREAKKEREAEAEPEPEPEPEESSAPPNVVGLPLPAAEAQLSAAGYTTAAVNTDTLFGIVNEDNYTICKQNPPRGNVVKVLAQKYGC